jgi:hypothetical protein
MVLEMKNSYDLHMKSTFDASLTLNPSSVGKNMMAS